MLEAILEIRVPHYCVLGAARELGRAVQVVRLSPHNGYVNHLIRVGYGNGKDASQVLRAVSNYSTSEVSSYSATRSSIFVITETPACALYNSVRNNGCFILDEASMDGDRAQIRVLVPSKICLRRLLRQISEHDGQVKLVKVSKPRIGERLTQRQREILLEAVKSGYFDYPRQITARELARKLQITSSTLSETLRKSLRKILDHYVE